ncbi:TonB-dependent receptor plug domain-containing protein [Paracidobacterium acidisoli]|uniref:TonB-dependent receptor n=1 Tax=Paracidobacterium acidisoli TaxID=2303751 RepID=A0A372IMK4_9BACT|nr:TonB-dependent receptor [Paracidobacterium acidisoli]MBT9332419.1 TonB-dependent receptor [Paracidobacterium acidisoli]
MHPRLLFVIVFLAASAGAQQKPTLPSVNTTVVVLGSPVPVSEQDSARAVVSLDTQRAPLAFHQIEDYLRTDSSVDIQQRGGGGIMADISVRGASFEQTLVLVDGLRMDDSETAHFNMDLPIPLLAIERLDVLHGDGSTLYGSDAIGGVVDLSTVKPADTDIRLRTGAGSFGENEQAAIGSITRKKWSDVLAGDRELSTGFMTDRDYRTENASNEFRFASLLGHSDLLFAGDDRAYGANQFYGPYESWERTKGWFAALTQQLNSSTQLAAAYRRHSDIYLLERDQPEGYKNQHIDDGFEGAIRDQRTLVRNLTLSTGLEEDTDQIVSTNLGQHGRNRGAGYAAAEWLESSRGSISLGAREEIFSGGRSVFSPMISATRWLSRSTTLHASVGHGFRIPTFLDLYYSDPSTLGNPNLRPESAWNFDAGASWFPAARVAATITAFYARQHDTIDYTRASVADPWQASNLPGVRFTGVEASVTWQLSSTERLAAGWTNLVGAQSALHGLQSEYVFNYPVNNGRMDWMQQLSRQVVLDTRLGVVQRFEKSPYAVWDVSVARQLGRVRPYLQMTNLANTGYEEIVNVRMPPRGFVGGLEIMLGGF